MMEISWKCAICQTEYHSDGFWDHVCSTCVRNAAIGAAVMRMPPGTSLIHWQGGKKDTRNNKWVLRKGTVDTPERYDSPLSALDANT